MKGQRHLEGLTVSEYIARHGSLPTIAGGEDALEVLKNIREKLEKGGQTPEELEQMRKDAAEAQTQATADGQQSALAELLAGKTPTPTQVQQPETPEQELERLRKEVADRSMRDSMAVIAQTAKLQAEQTAQAEQRKAAEMLREEIEKAMGGGAGQSAILDVLKNTRSGSRLVMPGATEDFAKRIASGEGLQVQDNQSIRTGIDEGVDQFMKSKSLALFMGAIMRAKVGQARDFELKALAESTESAGGYLVPPEWMDDVLKLLRPATVVLAAGPRTIPIGKSLHSVSLSGPGTVFWGAENAATPPSQETFAEVPLLSPHSLTGLIPASNQLLRDTTRVGLEDAEKIIREDLTIIMGLGIDLGFLKGSGSGGEPKGLVNMEGITNVTSTLGIAANGSFFDDDIARNMLARYRTFNLTNPRLAWFFHPELINQLEGLKDNEGRYLLETKQLTVNADQRTGTLWGVPFYTTTNIPNNQTRGESSTCTFVLLVDMNNLYVGESRELTLDSSSEASYTPDAGTTWINAFQSRQTLFRAEWIGDIAHRRPGAGVVYCEGIRVA